MIIILLVIAALVLLYLFLVMPRIFSRPDMSALTGILFAHRGLHDGHIKENTMEAFKAAKANGYGIEFDVRLSRDGVPVVAHDDTLLRVFGDERRVDEVDAAELGVIGVPSFEAVLDEINGAVPLLIEFKLKNAKDNVCAISAPLLDSYKGVYCIESFHPAALMWFKRNRPGIVRGQLATNFIKEKTAGSKAAYFLLMNLLTNVAARPDFIAYCEKYRSALPVVVCRRIFGAKVFLWTVHGLDNALSIADNYDGAIFEIS